MSRYLNEGAVWSAIKRIPHITIQTRQAILEALRKVPSADVKEVKHGQWSCYRISKDYIYMKYACSQCHYTNQYATDFCPHCGAQMDEEAVKE